MLAIYQYFGYDLPIQERFRKIKAAGFDAVGLWSKADWLGEESNRRQQAAYARNAGLHVIAGHAPRNLEFVDAIWLDNLDGQETYETYRRTIEICGEGGIKHLVFHVETDRNTPPPNELGIQRIQKLLDFAQSHNVTLALEHIRNHRYLTYVFERIASPNLRFCYDSGHQNCNEPEIDLLSLFGDKLEALHLHDNDGQRDQHLPPFKGTIDWQEKMEKIASLGYRGPIALECAMRRTKDIPPVEQWLEHAHAAAQKLEAMLLDSKQ